MDSPSPIIPPYTHSELLLGQKVSHFPRTLPYSATAYTVALPFRSYRRLTDHERRRCTDDKGHDD